MGNSQISTGFNTKSQASRPGKVNALLDAEAEANTNQSSQNVAAYGWFQKIWDQIGLNLIQWKSIILI